MNVPRRIVIIGGGQAAGWAAHTLRAQGYDGRLSVVADEAHDFYERPPLSKAVLAGQCEPAALALFDAGRVQALDIDWQRPRRAVAIEREARQVVLDDGHRLGYDRLLLATGSRPHVPDPAWLQIDGVQVLRNIDDALRLRHRLAASRRLAVLGGGWIGLEVAATARAAGLEVAVHEAGARLCGRSVGVEVADALLRLHRAQGVQVRLDCGQQVPVAVPGGGVRLGDEVYDAVLVGCGARMNLELALQAGLDTAQGVVVDAAGRTSDPCIFAAGDVAQHPRHGLCVQSWANAQHQAVAAAQAMLGQPASHDEIPWLWSDQYEHTIQLLGLHAPAARCIRREGSGSGGEVYFHLDADDRLQQLVAFDQPRLVKLARRWMQAGRVLHPQMLADPEADLMTLR